MAIKQPADKSHFILPDLGEGVHEAELLEWKVKPGETVEEHQTLAEMETDKARVEVPSPWAGVVKDLNGKEGDIITVGSVLVTYETKGGADRKPQDRVESGARAADEAVPAGAVEGDESDEQKPPAAREDAGTVVGNVSGSLTVSPRFARRREEENGQVARREKTLATPAVRRIARELGVDINRVPATGRGGRVTASDVQSFAQGQPAAPADRAPSKQAESRDRARTEAPAISSDGVSQRVPFRGIRRKIAQALSRSMHTAVHFTVVEEADVTALEKERRKLIFATGEKISLLPFILTAVIRALREHPSLNANVDDENEEILLKNVINLGVAVDTDHGLMVPVIHNADRLSLVELGRSVSDLAQQCHGRTVPRENLIGGTFTISNVGSFGGMFATPVINYPEVAILAAGRARERVVARDGTFSIGTVLPLSLSCDHRVVDGAEGTRFLNAVVRLLENPQALLQPE